MTISGLRVGVILLHYNGFDDTVECLESLYRMTYRHATVLVVNNGSTDDSAERLYQRFPRQQIITVPGPNQGYAAGINYGITEGLRRGYDLLLLLNNDTVVDPGCLTALAEAVEAASDIGCASPVIYYYSQPGRIWNAGQRDPVRRFWVSLESRDRPSDRPYAVDVVAGTALLVRREVLEGTGGISPQYYMYYEDVDFSLAVKRLGYRTVVVPQARVWHKIGTTMGGSRNARVAYYKARNLVLLLRRYYPGYLVTLLPFFAVMIAANLFRSVAVARNIDMFFGLLRGFGFHFRHNCTRQQLP